MLLADSIQGTYRLVRLGVVGLGIMGSRYTRLAAESPRAILAGVVDPDETLASEFAERYGCPAFGSTVDLLQTLPDIDAVIVAAPDHLHLQPTLDALDRGKAVFVEKPLATTLADAHAMIASASAADLLLMVGHTLRFDSRYASARDAIQSGEIGQVVHLSTRRNCPIQLVRRYGPRCSIVDFLGIHDIDYILWALDRKVVRVTAVARHGILASEGIDLDDSVFALLEFEDGVVGCVETSWCIPQAPGRKYNLLFNAVGTLGEINLVADEAGLLIRTGEGECLHPNPMLDGEVAGRKTGVYRDEFEHFLDCLVFGAQPLCTGKDAVGAVEVVAAIHDSLRTGGSVRLANTLP